MPMIKLLKEYLRRREIEEFERWKDAVTELAGNKTNRRFLMQERSGWYHRWLWGDQKTSFSPPTPDAHVAAKAYVDDATNAWNKAALKQTGMGD
jgi:hypothetical protein